MSVSIHAPAEGATVNEEDAYKFLELFQSTRPRRARPWVFAGNEMFRCVSIHAPAEGATSRSGASPGQSPCFNPRARGGRDPVGGGPVQAFCLFQSTRPRRARPQVQTFERYAKSMFQSTRPRRARPLVMACTDPDYPFQSTRPRRARPCPSPQGVLFDLFQSTRPRRARHPYLYVATEVYVFQSTRPRRARPPPLLNQMILQRFQSTRPRRARPT